MNVPKPEFNISIDQIGHHPQKRRDGLINPVSNRYHLKTHLVSAGLWGIPICWHHKAAVHSAHPKGVHLGP